MSLTSALWPVWIALTVALTAKPFLWHLEYFRRPAPQFFLLYLGAMAVLVAAAFLYVRLRRAHPALVGWEPRAFFGFFLALFFAYAPLSSLLSILIAFVCVSFGRLLLARLTESPLEQLTLWPAAGLGILSTLLFVLGLAGLYYRWLVLALLAAAVVAFWRNARRFLDLLRRAEAAYVARASDPLWGLCLVFVFVFGVVSAMVVLSPEIAYDPISFHFVLARDYASLHRLSVIAHFPYSYFPQGVELLYALGFLLDGQATAKVLTYAFFLLAAMSVALIGRRWCSQRGAAPLVAAALFVATPFISWTGSVAKNDLALALYLLLAFYGVARWIETARFGWLAAGAMFLAFAFGVKHVAVLGAVPLAPLVLWNLRHTHLSARQWGALAAIFLCCGLYWHIRTWILAGNPLYPEMGLSAIRSTTAEGHPQLGWLARLGIYALAPWTVHFHGLFAFESPSPNPAGFFLVAFFPLLWRRGGWKTRFAKLALFFCAAYFLYWAAILIKVRYAIAAFGVLFAFLADRMCTFIAPKEQRARRASVLGLASYCFLFALSLTLILEMNVPRLKLFAHRISREEFLRESLITYRSIEALNHLARSGERAYSVGNCSTFYANLEFDCYYDYQGNYSLNKIVSDIQGGHYQYLLVANSWADFRHVHVIEGLFHAAPVYEDESFRIYRLRRY